MGGSIESGAGTRPMESGYKSMVGVAIMVGVAVGVVVRVGAGVKVGGRGVAVGVPTARTLNTGKFHHNTRPANRINPPIGGRIFCRIGFLRTGGTRFFSFSF